MPAFVDRFGPVSRRPRSDHEWDILCAGEVCGQIEFVPHSDGRHQLAATIILNALNAPASQVAILAPPDAPFVAAGWKSGDEYRTQVQVIRDFVNTYPPEAKAEVQAAWERAEFPFPMTHPQMTAWQDTVLSTLTAFRAQEHAA